MNIDPRYLANLLSIAKHGSFNRAAAASGISQPALSNSIAQLERRLGVPVLDRSRRGSQLNEFGHILVRNAQLIEAILQQTLNEVRLKRLGLGGPLRVGAVPSLMAKFVPDLMGEFLRQHTGVSITVTEGLDDQLSPALLSGELDVVMAPLSGLFPGSADIIEDVLFEDRFSIGVGPSHELRNRRSLTLSELGNAGWVLPVAGTSLRRHIEALFMSEGVEWPSNCVLTSSLALVESVLAKTDRVAIITDLQVNMQNIWRIRSIPLKGGGKRMMGLKWRKASKLSDVMTAFVQICHEIVSNSTPYSRTTKQRKSAS